MKNIKYYLLFLGLITITFFSVGQEQKSLAEKLGYSADTKLLIVHADDLGVAHSANAASVEAFKKKGITCGSIMVPCPWFPEIADIVKNNPEYDVGIHLTLTAEWDQYKWDGVLPASEIPSLINEDGYFYADAADVIKHANPEEVDKEIRAQIDRALAFGIKPTHIDNHMGPLFMKQELMKIYLKVGRDYNLPVLIPSNYMGLYALMGVKKYFEEDQVTADVSMKMKNSPAGEWNVFYNEVLDNLKPGLNELIVHLAFDNDEMQAVASGHPDYGSQWRQNDLDYLVSDEFKKKLEENNIKLVGWREIKEILYPDNPF